VHSIETTPSPLWMSRRVDGTMGFVRVEKRGSSGTSYYYLCSYDRKTRNVHKRYLGPVDSAEARRKAGFFKWINSLNEQEVKRLGNESAAVERSRLSFHTSLERVLELGQFSRSS